MRHTFQKIALTLASAGVLAAAAGAADDTRRLHDEMRVRVLREVGDAQSPASLRRALARDPDFDQLLTRIRRDWLLRSGSDDLAEDAVQEALLKAWRGRPALFLRDLDEVIRYLRVAARRNACTAHHKVPLTGVEAPEAASSPASDPAAAASAGDLLDRLVERLDPAEREILAQRLRGVRSQRDVAKGLQRTRYQAMQGGAALERKARALLGAGQDTGAA